MPLRRPGKTKTAGLIGGSAEGVHDDDAALHYEFDLAEDGDVREGVALDGDEVGPSRLPSQLRASRINPSRLRVNELGVLEGADLANPSSAKDEMVSSMGEFAEF